MIVIRVFTLIFSIAALTLMIVLLFFPFFISEPKRRDDNATSENGGSFTIKADVNLWDWHEWPPGSNNNDSQRITKTLRLDYFPCDAGKLRIQVVEGMAIIACILSLANFVMSILLFCYPTVMRLPLSLYFMLAALASATILILMMWWYTKSWCDTQMALNEDKNYNWDYGIGWKLIIASCGSSVVGCILAAVSC